MHDHIQMFRLPPDAAHALLMQRRIDYLAICSNEAELGYYARKDPKGLWAQMKANKVPVWLEPLPDMGEGIKVWRVR